MKLLKNMRIDITFDPVEKVPDWAIALQLSQQRILQHLGLIEKEIAMVDRSIDEVLADVQSESTQIDGLTTLTASIKTQLDAALSGSNIPPDVQAKINAVFDGIEANKSKVMGAINANTPAAPVDPSAPGDSSSGDQTSQG